MDADEPWRRPGARILLHGRAAQWTRRGCHALHMLLVVYGLAGWLAPSPAWLVLHMVFLPGLAAVWAVNGGVCPLNNLESRLTTGRWRNPGNPDEGGFLKGLLARYLGLEPTERQMAWLTYGLMAAAWLLSAGHLALRWDAAAPS